MQTLKQLILSRILLDRVQFDDLSKNDAIKIKSVWPHRSEHPENYVEHCMEYNSSMGIFNETGELVAWCLRHDFGPLAILQVDDRYRRQGYGQLVMAAISYKVAMEYDTDVTAFILVGNA